MVSPYGQGCPFYGIRKWAVTHRQRDTHINEPTINKTCGNKPGKETGMEKRPFEKEMQSVNVFKNIQVKLCLYWPWFLFFF